MKNTKSRRILSLVLVIALAISSFALGSAMFTIQASAAATVQASVTSGSGYNRQVWLPAGADTWSVSVDSEDHVLSITIQNGSYAIYAFYNGTGWNIAPPCEGILVSVDASGNVTYEDVTITAQSNIYATLTRKGTNNYAPLRIVGYGGGGTTTAPEPYPYDDLDSDWDNSVSSGSVSRDSISKLGSDNTTSSNGNMTTGFYVNKVSNTLAKYGGTARTVSVYTINASDGSRNAKNRAEGLTYKEYYDQLRPAKSGDADYYLHDYYLQGTLDTMPGQYGWKEGAYGSQQGWWLNSVYSLTGKAYGVQAGGQLPWSQLDYLERDGGASGSGNANGWLYGYDELQNTAYLWKITDEENHLGVFISYENEKTLEARTDYVIEEDLGGLIMWDTSGDAKDSAGNYIMMNAAKAGIGENKNLIGYFCNWSVYSSVRNTQKLSDLPWGTLDFVNYSFFSIGDPYNSTSFTSGSTTFNAETKYSITSIDPWSDFTDGSTAWHYGQLTKLTETQKKDTKLMASVGGWTRGDLFSRMAMSATNRKVFTDSVYDMFTNSSYPVKLQNDNGIASTTFNGTIFDGLDLDWEYPGVNRYSDLEDPIDRGAINVYGDDEEATDKAIDDYIQLVKDCRAMLNECKKITGKDYYLSACLPADPDKMGIQRVWELYDAITDGQTKTKYGMLNIMTYDIHGAFDPINEVYDIVANGNSAVTGKPIYAAKQESGRYYDLGYNSPLKSKTSVSDKTTTELEQESSSNWSTELAVEYIKAALEENGVDVKEALKSINIGTPLYSRGWAGVSYDPDTGIPYGLTDPTPFNQDSLNVSGLSLGQYTNDSTTAADPNAQLQLDEIKDKDGNVIDDGGKKETIAINQDLYLDYLISPSTATNQKVEVKSGNDGIATAVQTADGKILVVGKGVGTTIITVTTEDGEKTSTFEVTVEGVITTTTSTTTTTTTTTTSDTTTTSTTTDTTASTSSDTDTTTSTSSDTDTTTSTSSDTDTTTSTSSDTDTTTSTSSDTDTTTSTSNDTTTSTTTTSVTPDPESVTVSPGTQTLSPGDKKQLTATVTPAGADQTVTWSSSDKSVATVDSNGVVTAVGAGTVKIIATTANGKSGFATITVISAEVVVTGISVTPKESYINTKNTVQLSAKVTPSNATNTAVTWSSGDTSVATVDKNGLVTGVGSGKVTITAKASNGIKDTATVYVSFEAVFKLNSSWSLVNSSKFVQSNKILGSTPKVQLYNGRTMVPLRFVSETMGFKVSWDDATNTASVTQRGKTAKVTIGSNVMTIIDTDGTVTTQTIDVSARLIGASTYLPIRAISEALDCKVKWEEMTYNGVYTGYVSVSDYKKMPDSHMTDLVTTAHALMKDNYKN